MSREKQKVEIVNEIVNDCGKAPCLECMWCDQAAFAHAEALYNAGYRKQSEWISVEERVPKEVEHIIVCDEDGTVGEAIFLKATARFEWVDNEEIAFATHWMPLPEAPKLKGGGE